MSVDGGSPKFHNTNQWKEECEIQKKVFLVDLALQPTNSTWGTAGGEKKLLSNKSSCLTHSIKVLHIIDSLVNFKHLMSSSASPQANG